jgi:hypothetical protein
MLRGYVIKHVVIYKYWIRYAVKKSHLSGIVLLGYVLLSTQTKIVNVYALAYRYVYTVLHLGFSSAILFSYEMLLFFFYVWLIYHASYYNQGKVGRHICTVIFTLRLFQWLYKSNYCIPCCVSGVLITIRVCCFSDITLVTSDKFTWEGLVFYYWIIFCLRYSLMCEYVHAVWYIICIHLSKENIIWVG